jgi:ketosteroid isomerase-like protein
MTGVQLRRWAPALLVVFTACAHGKIGGTQIEDTDENREILKLVERYHRAVESRDADAVLAMVSPRYFEDNGNSDESDDYGYANLATALKDDFDRTKTIHLEIRVDDVVVDESTAHAFILYTVRGHADLPAGSRWKSTTDRARLTFEKQKDGQWLILSGL